MLVHDGNIIQYVETPLLVVCCYDIPGIHQDIYDTSHDSMTVDMSSPIVIIGVLYVHTIRRNSSCVWVDTIPVSRPLLPAVPSLSCNNNACQVLANSLYALFFRRFGTPSTERGRERFSPGLSINVIAGAWYKHNVTTSTTTTGHYSVSGMGTVLVVHLTRHT